MLDGIRGYLGDGGVEGGAPGKLQQLKVEEEREERGILLVWFSLRCVCVGGIGKGKEKGRDKRGRGKRRGSGERGKAIQRKREER